MPRARQPLLAWWVVAVLVSLVSPAAEAQSRRDPLPAAVREALAQAQVPEEALVGLVMPLQGGGRRWERDADRPVQPGSTMKLVTSAVALDVLGPNFRSRTDLLRAGPLEGDILRGDLVLRGGADPEFDFNDLFGLLNEARERGIREIAGDVVIDRSLFHPSRLDRGVPPFDEAPEWTYNVIPDALNLAGSLLSLEITADAQTAVARPRPLLDGIELKAGFTLVDGRCAGWAQGWQPAQVQDDGQRVVVELRGTFPRHCTAQTALQLIDRDRLVELMVRTLWSRLGGSIAGRVREGTAPAEAALLARHLGRPWGELLRPLNKRSDNAMTRLLYLQLGIGGGQRLSPDGRPLASVPAASAVPAAGPNGGYANGTAGEIRPTVEKAEREVHRWFGERGIPTQGLVVDNGSGLSRAERLTSRQLALLLRHALTGPHGPDLWMSLPTAGVDGTMRNRLKDTPAQGWARVKTGTLRNVVALAGVVPDRQRRPWVFVAIVNHDNASRARPALDALVAAVAAGEALPTAARSR
jgi:D-alanyl-D-alanine carboxypeptidase/D-alanyl-D-alanine-endopeptidase (penicillin-binding protein 4)